MTSLGFMATGTDFLFLLIKLGAEVGNAEIQSPEDKQYGGEGNNDPWVCPN